MFVLYVSPHVMDRSQRLSFHSAAARQLTDRYYIMWKQAQYLEMKENLVFIFTKNTRSQGVRMKKKKGSRSLDQIARYFQFGLRPPKKNVNTSRHWLWRPKVLDTLANFAGKKGPLSIVICMKNLPHTEVKKFNPSSFYWSNAGS